jgi:glycosyltransferase involved in cell wall biosynthesis
MSQSSPDREIPRIAVVIPCHRVRNQILSVLDGVGSEVAAIYVVDDCCPESSGALVEEAVSDPRVQVLYHPKNQGVGGATITGYRRALADGAQVIVKLDGDGQMEPSLIPSFVEPILSGYADYTKGNRFYQIEGTRTMPSVRRLGNVILSFFNKLSSGYWSVFDPTNGFTAIHGAVARAVPLDKLDRRYFFESDILFRLNVLGAVVCDIPMSARYADEATGLNVLAAIPKFLYKHLQNLFKRIVYTYYLRDFTIASIELIAGLVALAFGGVFGVVKWIESATTGQPASAGTVMVAALPVILGTQLLLAFLSFDTGRREAVPLHQRLGRLVPEPPTGLGESGIRSGTRTRDGSA